MILIKIYNFYHIFLFHSHNLVKNLSFYNKIDQLIKKLQKN